MKVGIREILCTEKAWVIGGGLRKGMGESGMRCSYVGRMVLL